MMLCEGGKKKENDSTNMLASHVFAIKIEVNIVRRSRLSSDGNDFLSKMRADANLDILHALRTNIKRGIVPRGSGPVYDGLLQGCCLLAV